MNDSIVKSGFVALVGAGPGALSLLTLRGKALLECADVVVYDRLVSVEIMGIIPSKTRLINVGKENNHHRIPQEEINQILVKEALEGNRVVRLKGGDPFVFGRGGEEIESLIEYGISYEVVPGITSSIAAPSFAGIPVTHRDFCSSFHVITGHQKKNGSLQIDFESLVKTKGTLIFLMGVSTLRDICNGLMEAGMDKQMPVALVENGTRSYQRKLIGTIENLYEKAVEENFQSPSVIIVGKVCTLSWEFDWFSKAPLFGQKIIVTSPVNSARKLQGRLHDLGAQVYELPMIQIEKCIDKAELDQVIKRIKTYKYLVFTSKNGVTIFFDYLATIGKDARILGEAKVVAVGPSTAEVLRNYGIVADRIPKTYNAETLVQELEQEIQDKEQEKVLLIRGKMGSKEANGAYDELRLYETVYQKHLEVEALTKEKIMVCFTSASTVEGFIQNHPSIENVQGICIGEQTAAMAEKYGLEYVVSREATIESMIEKVLESR